MESLAQYKHVFGKSGKGIHSVRLLDVAFVDYALTIVASVILAWVSSAPLVLTTIFMFVLAIAVHWLFGVKTSAVEYLTHMF